MSKETTRSEGTWTSREAYLLGLVCLMAGLLIGYVFRGSAPLATGGSSASAPVMPAPSNVPAATSAPATAESVQPLAAPLLAVLRVDPKNVESLVQLGNLYYDHHVYPQAIEYYTRALELRPSDVNVRTDLGTAYWYSNLPQQAVKEYEKSLAINPSHPNTLFNMGIVRSQGLQDPAGAIVAWEKLLKTNPDYREKQRVLDLITKARSQPR